MSNINYWIGGKKMNCNTHSCGPCGTEKDRHFLTKEEKIEMLTEYQETLDKEAKGVSERISELKKAG